MKSRLISYQFLRGIGRGGTKEGEAVGIPYINCGAQVTMHEKMRMNIPRSWNLFLRELDLETCMHSTLRNVLGVSIPRWNCEIN